MFGDHKQLPPTLMSERAGKGGLSTSLFERLTIRGFPVNLLSIQYRMLPGNYISISISISISICVCGIIYFFV